MSVKYSSKYRPCHNAFHRTLRFLPGTIGKRHASYDELILETRITEDTHDVHLLHRCTEGVRLNRLRPLLQGSCWHRCAGSGDRRNPQCTRWLTGWHADTRLRVVKWFDFKKRLRQGCVLYDNFFCSKCFSRPCLTSPTSFGGRTMVSWSI